MLLSPLPVWCRTVSNRVKEDSRSQNEERIWGWCKRGRLETPSQSTRRGGHLRRPKLRQPDAALGHLVPVLPVPSPKENARPDLQVQLQGVEAHLLRLRLRGQAPFQEGAQPGLQALQDPHDEDELRDTQTLLAQGGPQPAEPVAERGGRVVEGEVEADVAGARRLLRPLEVAEWLEAEEVLPLP